MALERAGNIWGYEVEASDDFAFPTVADMSAVAGGAIVTQDIDITDLGVPAIRLAEIMTQEFSDSAGNTALPNSNALANLITVSVVDNDTIRISLDPSGVSDANAGMAYSQLTVEQDEPGD